MQIQVIDHAPFEKLGAIETWMKKRDFTAEIFSPYKNARALDQAIPADFLIIMGGPQSSLDVDKIPICNLK